MEYGLEMSTATHAAAGTCRMGPVESRTAVVDARLCVHGLRGLRVVGSAVAPGVLSGRARHHLTHCMFTVYLSACARSPPPHSSSSSSSSFSSSSFSFISYLLHLRPGTI